MSHSIDAGCPHTDAVLARHLDGHVTVDGAPAMSAAAMGATPEQFAAGLDAHLAECVRCQQALRRARRLDAALAHEAGQFVATQGGADGELAAAERWFAAVAAAALEPGAPPVDGTALVGTPVDGTAVDETTVAARGVSIEHPQPRIAAPSPFRAWFTSLAAAAGTLAAVAWWIAGGAHHRDVEATPAVGATATAPSAAGSSSEEPSASSTPLPQDPPIAGVSTADAAPVAIALDLQRLPKWAKARTDTPAQPTRTRPGAARQPGARQPDLLALRRQLDDGDATEAQLVFCAQLAHGDLDEALRRHLRRCPQRLDTVVAALQAGTRQHGTAQLLLDLWDDGVCRDRLPDDERAAARLFAGQRADTFRQVQRELATCAQAARRGRCLLALGCARDVDVSPSLLAQLEAPRREEAVLAAFALSCLPGPVLARVAQREPTSFLLRAALLRSEADELAAFHAHCGEPAELRQRLRGASLPVFCELASWLRHGADASE